MAKRYYFKFENRIPHIRINEKWFSQETFDLLDELEGNQILFEYYKDLMKKGEETKETLNKIEEFRHLRAEGEVKYERYED